MKNNLLRKSTPILCVLMMLNFLKVSAQQNVNLINAHLESERVRNSWLASDITGYLVSDQYSDERTGCTYAYIQQRHHNIAVFNAISAMLIKDNKVLYFAPALIDHLEQKIKTDKPSITAEAAIGYALIYLGREIAPAKLIKTDNSLNAYFFESPAISPSPIKVQLVYRAMDDGIYLAWDVSIEMKNESHWWNVRVNALTGDYLDKNDWVTSCSFEPYHNHAGDAGEMIAPAPYPGPLAPPSTSSYNIFQFPIEAPSFGSIALINDPSDNMSSPFGWHDDNGVTGADYTITRGNNVYAYEDQNADNIAGYSPDGTSSLTFNYVFNPALAPTGNMDASITNLFYACNRIHDVTYHAGFTEAAGNFQANNYGNGGLGNDYVKGEAFDGSGTNNANFGTPPDGTSGRMQMYLWTAPTPDRDGSFDNGIITHEYGHGVSTRLTGGPANSNCLSNSEQGGEGWSDWLALVMTTEPQDTTGTNILTQARGIGTYALNQATNGPGIRRYRYSVDMAINPQTYADVAASVIPHGVGEIWCDAIWDMTSFLIFDHGFNSDPANTTAGNNIAIRLVLEGMKLQPCNPGFLDARDAILAADAALYGNAHLCRIWQAFARRGMGFSAVQGSSNSTADQTAAFNMPPSCLIATQAPVAGFTSNVTSIACAASVAFTDTSVQAHTWSWDFGDGGTSIAQSPTHVYNSPGTYTVKLVITNTLGSDSVTKINYITVSSPFTVTATATPASVCSGNPVTLTGTATGSSVITYVLDTIPYAPLTSGTTTVLTPLSDDAMTVAQPIGFTFTFYGVNYTQFYLCSNGFITFLPGQPTTIYNGPVIPTTGTPNGVVALAWADMYPLAGTGSVIDYFVTGSAPTRQLVIRYNTRHFAGAAYPFIMQAILYEGTNVIEIHTTTISNVSAADPGATATQGVENQTGTKATTVPGRNGQNFSATNDAFRFTPATLYTYNWQPGNINAATAVVNPVSATAYTLSVGDGSGCIVNQTASVTILPALTPSITGNLSFCSGSSTTLDAGAGDSLYNWSTGATTQTISVNAAGTYTVTVTNANGCTGSTSATVTQLTSPDIGCHYNSPTCVGSNDGEAYVIVFTTSPVTYLWSTGATTDAITVPAGTYTVTVTDANGCTATCESYVYDPEPINVSCNASPVTCFGAIDGTASVTASQGEASPTFAYLWTTGATTSSLSGLPAGTYTVTVTDPDGCTATCSSVVTQPSQILITETHSDGTCGQTNGSIDVTASGGTPGGYYVDNFNDSNSSASLISRGYVLYRNGTFSSATGPLWDQGNGNVFPAFNGGPNGYVADNYTAAGGIGDIDDWMILPAQNITAGDIMSFYSRSPLNDPYADSIRVMYNTTGATLPSDPNWTELGRFKVNTAGAWLQSVYNATAAGASGRFAIRYCVADGGLNGSNSDYIGVDALQLTRAGGPSYSYLWSDGNTNQDRSGLNGGTYTVTVTDGNGCTGTLSVTINFNANPTPVITGNLSFCSGGSTTLDAGLYAGYNWSTGATTQTISVNSPGDYTVTVTDANGCTGSSSVTVILILPPPCIITGNDFCTGGSTQLCAATSSSYLWSTGATTQCITTGTAGTYTVTVTNASGCTSSCSKTIVTYPLPACSITGSDFCNGSSTQLCTPAVPGGVSYFYLWSTGATTQCITVTTGGTYTVTVTDYNGCTNTCSKTVTEYPKPACSITGSNFCSGSGSQLCAASVPGPSVNTYLWNTGSTTQCITVTSGGTYTVTVTNANGCTSSCSKTLTEYPKPACSITGNNFCSGSGSQLCAASVPGPSVNTYLWNTGSTTQCITVTSGGTYSVTVTDANGCTNSCSKTVTAYPLPVCSITGGNFCQGSSTQLCAATNSGYLWSTGSTTQCITVTSGGTYTVTVTNANGCTSSCSKTVTAYPLPACAISGNIAYCDGSTTQLCGTPGMSSYLWSTGATTQCIAAAGGDYTVTVTNSNGCTSSCSITTHLRLVPVCSITGGNFCAGNSTQLCATIAPVGYVFSYAWSTGATTQCITLTTGGTYTVNITNQYGCSSSCNKTITVSPTPVCTITGNIAYCEGSTTQLCGTPGMSSYLWSTGATAQCIAAAGGDYTVTVTNANGCTSSCSITTHLRLLPVCNITGNNFCNGSSGQLCATTAPAGYVFSYIWNTGATTQCITITAGGTYSVTISNQYGCTSSCSKTITRYALPVCSITGTASICTGNSTQWCAPAGLAAYLWSNGATTQCITVSTAATYTVTVTNTTGCTKSCSKTLTTKALPNCTVTGTASVCPGSSAQWCAPAGLAGYLWSSGATTQCITVNTAGTYTVTVTNTTGCTKSCSKTLTVKGVPACSITGTASICPGGATQWCAPAGLAAYLWSNGATTQCVSVSTAAVYTVTITNGGGCTSSCSKTLTIKTPPSCSINGGNICQGGSTQLCVAATAANYLWSTGATTKCITVSAAGIYTVTVTGTNGCTSSCSKNVTVSTLPSCAITWNHGVCQGGSAQFCAPAGLSSYLWNTGATSQCISISTAGDYTVTVSNTSGCTNSCTVKVIVYSSPACSITGNSVVSPGQTTPLCAPAGLTYLWNNGATTQCRNVAAGTYTVTVTNANGCTSSCSKTVTSAAKMVEPVVTGGDNGAIEALAYPNPFNQEATIEFRNTIASGHVVVELFNLTGSKMAVLFDKDVEQNVTYQTKVHSEDLAEGVYFYRIVSGNNVITGKLILLKE